MYDIMKSHNTEVLTIIFRRNKKMDNNYYGNQVAGNGVFQGFNGNMADTFNGIAA